MDLHFYDTFPGYWLLKVLYNACHIHTQYPKTNGRGCHARCRAAHQEKESQECFDVQPGEPGIGTNDPPITGRLTLPPTGLNFCTFYFICFPSLFLLGFQLKKGHYMYKSAGKKQCTLLILGVSCQFESHKFPPLEQPGSKHFNKIGVFLCLAADITNEWA